VYLHKKKEMQTVKEQSTRNSGHPRIAREFKTIRAMITLYCHDHHATDSKLCSECRALLDYAGLRLEKCPFQENKTTCANCAVHCYNKAMREKVKEVMRYSGPRMTYRHPFLALLHLMDGRRKIPASGDKG
jgi:hypothetical protein